MKILSVSITSIFIFFVIKAHTSTRGLHGVRLRELLQEEEICCRAAGEALGLSCGCRQACTGSDCSSLQGSLCGTGVCCCGNGCVKELQPHLDVCPTAPPTTNPTSKPTANPSQNPSQSPSFNPSPNPTRNPSANPTESPTVPQCAAWSPGNSTSDPVANDTNSSSPNIPIPDVTSPQLCQLGKSGAWNSMDQWYSWDCSCYDAMTRFVLTQFIQGWFMEFQINYSEQREGRFESWFNNYCTEDIFFETTLSSAPSGSGRNWNDLQSLTSCDAQNPGYGELSRQLIDGELSIDFQIVPGGVSLRDCSENGNVASGRLIINNYRLRDVTENLVVFGDFTIERQQNSNMWLIKEIVFTSNPVGFLSQQQP